MKLETGVSVQCDPLDRVTLLFIYFHNTTRTCTTITLLKNNKTHLITNFILFSINVKHNFPKTRLYNKE